eukprot:175827-Pleurochrysis_carterae.AAC.1
MKHNSKAALLRRFDEFQQRRCQRWAVDLVATLRDCEACTISGFTNRSFKNRSAMAQRRLCIKASEINERHKTNSSRERGQFRNVESASCTKHQLYVIKIRQFKRVISVEMWGQEEKDRASMHNK